LFVATYFSISTTCSVVIAQPSAGPSQGESCLLYVHIPFCEALCPFCAFHRVEYTRDKALPYFEALRAEIRHYYDRGFIFSNVYIDGGTPTVNAPELAEIIGLIRS